MTSPTDARISARLLLAAGVIFGLFAWGSARLLQGQAREMLTAEVAAGLSAEMTRQASQLGETMRLAEREVRFFAATPPIAGIGRALAHNGVDPVDANTLEQWQRMLEQFAQAYLAANPRVFQLRLIGLTEDGLERVRVVRDSTGSVSVAGADRRQRKGHHRYFQAALAQPAGGVWVSPIDLNLENDQIEQPPRPTLRAALAVRNAEGEPFGVLVVNVLAQPLLEELASSGLEGVQHWITDAAGHSLWDREPGRAFDHWLKPPGTPWTEVYPPVPGAEPPAQVPEGLAASVRRGPDGVEWLIFTRPLRAAEADGTGGVVLHAGLPLSVLAARAWSAVTGTWLLMLGLGGLVLGLVVFMPHRSQGTPLGLTLAAEPGRTLRVFGLELPLTATGQRPLWRQVAAALMPVVWWGLLTVTLGQPLRQPFIILLLPVLLASWWGGLYAGLVASGLAVVGAWDLGTDSPPLDFTNPGDPINPFSAFTLLVTGFLVTLSQEAIRRYGVQVVVAERAKLEERKAAEQSLRRFKSTLDSTHDAVFMFDPDTLRFFYVNQGACEQVGYTEAELLGMHPYDLKPEYPDADLRRRVAPLRDGTVQSLRFETVHRHRDGHDLPVEVYLQYIAPEGEPARFVNIVTDITARRAAEAALRRSEEEFRTVVESSPNGIVLADGQGIITLVNAKLERETGYTRTELLGQPVETLVPARHAGAHPGHRRHYNAHSESRAMGAGRDLAVRRKDGSEFPAEIGLAPITTPAGKMTLATVVDITKRQAAERALRQSEAKFHALFDEAPDAYLLMDSQNQGRITACNKAAEKMLRGPTEQIIGKTPADLSPLCQPDGQLSTEAAQDRIRVVMETGSNDFEWMHQRLDGEEFWAQVTCSILPPADRGIMIIAWRDITEKKHIRSALESEVQKNRMLLQTACDSVHILDARGQVLECSESFAAGLGYTVAEALQLNLCQWEAQIPPDQIPPMLDQLFRLQEPRTFETQHRRRDGSVMMVEVRARPVLVAGRPLLYCASRDITERKALVSEVLAKGEQLSNALSIASAGTWRYEVAADLFHFDDDFYRMFGTSAAEVGGYALSASDYAHRFIHPDDVSVVEEGIRKALAADDPSFTGLIEHRFLRKDKIGWMAVHYGVKQDDSGQISLLEGMNRVITEQKEGEFALQREKALSEAREAREAAEAANRAKSQFLSNMSHEIRTPLNIIIHSCYLLDKTRLDEQQTNRVRTIETAGEALLWQINEILDLAKIESGEVPLQNHPFLLSALWDDLDRIFTPEAESRGLTLTLPSASTLRAVRLHGDQGKLRQTLTNLVANALKFTEHGGVQVEATLRTEMTGATWLTVRVRDTGIGIPDDQRDALFKPFSQLDTSDTRRFGGTGLGLSIVKLMSERVGGQVGVESSPGQGSCFWIDWPFESLPLEAAERSLPAQPGDPAGLDLADTCILVADDNAVARDVCRHVLETQGAQVELAASGKEALECIAASPLRFDAVLMDIQMPGMDGLEACRHLRQGLASDDLPIIALSAGALSEQREAALAAGMTDFLSKPVKPRHLIETLRQRIAARRGEAVPHPAPIGPGQAPSDWPTIDGLERDQAYELLMGNLTLYGRLLTGFMARSPSLMETLSSPITAKARAARHQLLGMTGNIGATRLYQQLDALDGTGANGHFDRAAVEAVQASYRSLMDALDTHRADWQRPVSLEASTVDLSAQALHARLDALLEDVRQHHARALTEVDRLTPCWSGTPEEAAWRLVSDALSRVDFPAAGQHLADFMRRLRTPPA